jgi:glycosyltransferase involved in cell wall biosynthesis
LRLAALVATEAISGPGRQLAALAQRLEGLGTAVLAVLFHRPGGPPSAYARYLERAHVEHEVVADRGPLDVRLPAAVGAILRRWRPTIVQTHGYKATGVAYLLRRAGNGWRWVGCFHGATAEDVKVRLYHRLDRWMLRRADRIVVMSSQQAAQFAACGSRVRVIRNAVLPLAGEVDPDEEQRLNELQGALTRPVLGVVGRLSPEKGVDVFLEACALLARRGFAFSAVVAGDGPERDRLERQRERLGLSARVHFLGHVRGIEALYPSLDLLVIPSRSEGLPNALLEGLGAGVAVVGTRVGAIPDVLDGLAAGVLVDPGSADALAAGVEQAIAQRSAVRTAEARETVLERFSLERRVAEHVALYRELVPAPGGCAP